MKRFSRNDSPCFDSANNCCMRSRVRNMRLIVLIASTLVALVRMAGATINVSTANGLCVNEFGPMALPFRKNSTARRGGTCYNPGPAHVLQFKGRSADECFRVGVE